MLPADTVEDLRVRARHGVRGGYVQPSALIDELVELIEYDPATQQLVASDRSQAVAEVSSIVTEEDSRYLAEAASWPPQTDCDRISAVFAELSRQGIVARENVGYTQSDLQGEMSEAVADLAKAGRAVRGWVAFHGQDVERAVDGRGLFLGFAAADRANEAAWVQLATDVVEAFRQAGFTVTWNGTTNQRPHLAVNWQRRWR